MSETVKRYSAPSRVMHWLGAAIIFTLVAVGLYMADLPDNDPNRLNLFAMHKSFGIVVLMLLVARLVWLRVKPGPQLPAVFNDKEKLVTVGIRALLYVLMFAVPVSGWVMSNSAGYPVSLFGLFDLPTLVGKSEELHEFTEEAHEVMAFAIIGLVLLHMAGAIKHRLADKGGESDVLSRML